MREKSDERSHARSVLLLAAVPAVPALIAAGVLLWIVDGPPLARAGAGIVLLALSAAAFLRTRREAVDSLRSVANVLSGLRLGDVAVRATGENPDDPLGLVAYEANRLADDLRERRLEARETDVLLERVMEEIDAAVFAFDGDLRLRLVNRAGAELLDRDRQDLTDARAGELGLSRCLRSSAPAVLETSFPGSGAGRWEVRRTSFRLDGRPHRLLVLTDVSRILRREERRAWRRLIRVLSHEINNSLAPIRSVAASLRDRLGGEGADRGPEGARDELARGLDLIARRARSLNSFLDSYAQLARLPEPEPEEMDVEDWVRDAVDLKSQGPIQVRPGPPASIRADPDQMDQLLLNLLDNAVGAAARTGGSVLVEWSATDDRVELRIVDDGPGLADDANLFVPFFTTKDDGSGIGLALGRQIVEAHGGSITLENRESSRGCVARVRLPRAG